jgi:hypothetical protein
MKTGSYSVHVVLPGENTEDFQALLNGLLSDFNPRTTMESALVNDIAILVWKKLRLEKASHALIASKLSMPPTDENFKSIFADKGIPDGVAQYVDQALMMNDADELTVSALLPLAEEWCKTVGLTDNLSPTDSEHFAPLIEYLVTFKQRGKARSSSGKFVFGAGSPDFDRSHHHFAEAEIRCFAWLLKNRRQIQAAMAEIKSGAILDAMNDVTTSRASDDLNRNLYRALAELRKQQDWRLHISVQDVKVKMT